MPGYFGHAEPLVEGLGAMIGGKHLQDQVLVLLPGPLSEYADDAGADTAALIVRVDFDAGDVDLARGGARCSACRRLSRRRDDLPAAGVEGAGVKAALDLLIPAPGRSDVVAHGGLVQLVAELAVGACGGPQFERGMPAGSSLRISVSIVS